MRNRAPSSLRQVVEEGSLPETDASGLPTYASAVHPSTPTSYGFIRSGPFAMIVTPDAERVREVGLYHVSVGVNIWMPSSTVTTIRRGSSEEGQMVAEIE